jgi:DNA ligase (NAD+)
VELTEVAEVGPKVAASIVEFFSERANRGVIERLRAAGVDPQQERQAPQSTLLTGKTFVFTGALARRSREEAGALVVAHSGKISNSVSKNTDYVVVGSDPGSKANKAKSLGVTTLSEDDFDALLAGRLAVSAPDAKAPARKPREKPPTTPPSASPTKKTRRSAGTAPPATGSSTPAKPGKSTNSNPNSKKTRQKILL